ncbi:hypothetical protein LX59_02271 [Azomonas agilis]|uniref:DUF469 family protein n=1 Tax=Azomonas agilis TaxID=116849 RepID=A0A562I0Q8_9GAMM|nr:YggL family protein [Azomonas agilis]TWH64601.1 hypothetical protein LX59_02271 [Azomonas agilis]
MLKPVSKPRSRRLRKKLHIDEFQQLGFRIEFKLRPGMTDAQEDNFWDEFILEAIEANQLLFAGSETGFVVPMGSVSATPEHQQRVQTWLKARLEVFSVNIGPLMDAWYPESL